MNNARKKLIKASGALLTAICLVLGVLTLGTFSTGGVSPEDPRATENLIAQNRAENVADKSTLETLIDIAREYQWVIIAALILAILITTAEYLIVRRDTKLSCHSQ